MKRGSGLFRDEFAKFVIKTRKLVTHDTALLRIDLPMLPNSWGEDFVPITQFPKSFCVMVGTGPDQFKPFTPVFIDNNHMDLLVKTYPLGRVSKALFELNEGDSLLIRGPREKFPLDQSLVGTKRLIAFAGGTGITPIYQVIKYLLSSKERTDVKEILLFDANKTRDDIILKEELDSLNSLHSCFKIDHVISSEGGRINIANLDGIEAREDDFIIVCGPKGFNEALIGNEKINGILRDKSYLSTQIYKF